MKPKESMLRLIKSKYISGEFFKDKSKGVNFYEINQLDQMLNEYAEAYTSELTKRIEELEQAIRTEMRFRKEDAATHIEDQIIQNDQLRAAKHRIEELEAIRRSMTLFTAKDGERILELEKEIEELQLTNKELQQFKDKTY